MQQVMLHCKSSIMVFHNQLEIYRNFVNCFGFEWLNQFDTLEV